MNHQRALAHLIAKLAATDNAPHRERVCPENERELCAGCPWEEFGAEYGSNAQCWWAFAEREGRE